MESLICIYLHKKVKMKYYLTSLVLFFCLVFHSQFDIFWDDDPGNIYNGQTINVSKDYGGFDVYMHCQNTSMATQEIKFRRLILSSSISFSDQFCDNNLCFPCFGNDWISPSSSTILAGDSSIMKGTFNFLNGGGTALVRYYVLDVNENPIDSVDVSITCTVGIDEGEISILTYPNPTKESILVDIPSELNGDLVLSFINYRGQTVKVSQLHGGPNRLSLQDVNAGSYIIILKKDAELIFTKRLIISH
jgi:hypothetical protein